MPANVDHFDAYIYAIVKRKAGKDRPELKWGIDVRLDPCELDWTTKTITITIPLNINAGITSIDDLDENYYEAVEAAFLSLMYGVMP